MFNRAPSLGRLTLVCLCLVVLSGLLLAVRCTHVASSPPASAVPEASPSAHLTMLNTSPCEWQIVMNPVNGGDRRTWKIAVAKSLEVELAGGDYLVEQTMLTTGVGPDATRRFSMRLTAGQSYRWRLVTLLSGEAMAAHSPGKVRNDDE